MGLGLVATSKPGAGAECPGHTVDGSEIRRSPVEVGSLSHYLRGFIHVRWVFAGFLPSTVGTPGGLVLSDGG